MRRKTAASLFESTVISSRREVRQITNKTAFKPMPPCNSKLAFISRACLRRHFCHFQTLKKQICDQTSRQILDWKPAILTEVFSVFPQSLQANAGKVP
jgi:hypothetical protein